MTSLSHIKAVIFDCDGTLVDSEYLNCLSCAETLKEAGHPEYGYDVIFERFVGLTLSEIFVCIEQEKGERLPEDMIERFLKKVEENTPYYLKRLDGAKRAVTWIADKGYAMCVASNGERQNVVNSIQAAELSEFFPAERVFTSALVAKGKPEPDLFLYAANQLGFEPNQCLVIEDTVRGVTAGQRAGMTTIGITTAHSTTPNYADMLKDAGADFVMGQWQEFYALFETI